MAKKIKGSDHVFGSKIRKNQINFMPYLIRGIPLVVFVLVLAFQLQRPNPNAVYKANLKGYEDRIIQLGNNTTLQEQENLSMRNQMRGLENQQIRLMNLLERRLIMLLEYGLIDPETMEIVEARIDLLNQSGGSVLKREIDSAWMSEFGSAAAEKNFVVFVCENIVKNVVKCALNCTNTRSKQVNVR